MVSRLVTQAIFFLYLIQHCHAGVAPWLKSPGITKALDVCYLLMSTAQRLADGWRHYPIRRGLSAGLKALKQAWG